MIEESAHYIEFRGVSKAFGDHVVLNDVSLCVEPGETLAVLGRSGVGKSVTLNLIMGFHQPDSGRVFVAHRDITGIRERELLEIHKKVTMVFQSGALFDSLSVGDNVRFPLEERMELSESDREEIVDGMLDLLEISNLKDLMPADLSTGMKRAVSIARAGREARSDLIRRADHHGRSFDVGANRRLDAQTQTTTETHVGGGDARHGVGAQSRRPRRIPA